MHVLKHNFKNIFVGTHIVHKTSDKIHTSSFEKAVPLLCMASIHPYCSYIWKLLSGYGIWPDTPVIYVTKPGLYECSVTTVGDPIVLQALYDVQLEGTLYKYVKVITM